MIGYETYGRGSEPVIVMHEWLSSHHIYEPMRRYLDPDSFTYLFVDSRGYGLSKGMSGNFTIDEAAGDVLHVADSVGIEQFHLIGHSMSGMIAQWISAKKPEKLKSLVLITPVPAQGMPLDENGQSLFGGVVHDDEKLKTVLNMVTQGRLSQRWYEDRCQQFRITVDSTACSAFLHMWTTTNFADKMDNLTTPCLLLTGELDFDAFLLEAYKDNIVSWYKNITTQVMPGCGHFPMIETPPFLAGTLESFLKQQIA